MNTRPTLESSSQASVLSVAFNQDASMFSAGLDSGFCVFNSDPCQLRVSGDLNGGIGRVQMLGRTNYIALVGGGRQPKFPQNKVIIWDDGKKKPVVLYELRAVVRGVKLSRTRVVIVLQNSVQVYKFSTSAERLLVSETADNPLGLCCLSSNLMAYPGRTPGQVQVMEIETGNITIVPAHTTALKAIEISPDGAIMATASDKGTLIRVFATRNYAKIAELRRGIDHATIFSLAFSPSSQQLAVTSDKSTLHIFDIPHPARPSPESPKSSPRLTAAGSGSVAEVPSQKWGILGRIPLLPRVFSDTYSFTSAHFEMGDEPLMSLDGIGGGVVKPQKGVIGWTSDSSLLIIGAGRDARWERFIIAEDENGQRHCVRDGWKKYLNAT